MEREVTLGVAARGRKTYGFLLIVLAALMGVGSVAFLYYKHTRVDVGAIRSEAYWAQEIHVYGGREAYKIFARRVVGFDEPLQHLAAHAFGAALYLEEGVNSLSVCDHRYGFGCFHQFMGHALSELGLSAAASLNEACFTILKDNWAWCHHAIGHGLVSTLGYEKENLIEALGVCRNLPNPDPVGGCFGGSFMEYNMRTMLGDESVRTFSGGPSDLCESVDVEYRKVCFYWLPQWWYASHLNSLPNEQAFRRMGKYCDEYADGQIFMESCYRGIGLITPQVSLYDPILGFTLCKEASENEARALACLSNAASVIGAVANQTDARTLCNGLAPLERDYCLMYASGKASQANPVPLLKPVI